MTVVDLNESWESKAACRGPRASLFFPPTTFERKADRLLRERQAKSICRTCTVTEPCLKYAISIREPHGIWGGLNETERKELLEESAV